MAIGFLHELLAMLFYRFDADCQRVSHHFIRFARGDQLQDLSFSRRQVNRFFPGTALVEKQPVLLLHRLGDCRTEECLASPHFPNCSEQIVSRCLLGDIPRRPRIDRVFDVVGVGGRGQNEHLGQWIVFQDEPGRSDAIQFWHHQIQQDYIWTKLFRQERGFGPAIGFTQHLDVELRFNQSSKALQHHSVIVNQQDSCFHGISLF